MATQTNVSIIRTYRQRILFSSTRRRFQRQLVRWFPISITRLAGISRSPRKRRSFRSISVAIGLSAVRAAWPATRPAHSLLKLRTYTLNVLLSGFRFFYGDNPADPFIARERRNILPFCQRRRVRNENLS